jgi:RNA polymerase sigma-70 factor (ECF subfamily)
MDDSSTFGVSGCPAETAKASGNSRLEEEVIGLFDQHRAPILRYLITLGLKTQDAEEVVQEAFLALFQQLQLGKSRENLRGWLFRVAHNQGLKQLQRNHRIEYGVDELRADPGPNAEEQLVQGEREQRLRAVFRALPQQDRWCLSLRAEGLRYREIADVLGMSLGAVSLSLARSVSRLSRV